MNININEDKEIESIKIAKTEITLKKALSIDDEDFDKVLDAVSIINKYCVEKDWSVKTLSQYVKNLNDDTVKFLKHLIKFDNEVSSSNIRKPLGITNKQIGGYMRNLNSNLSDFGFSDNDSWETDGKKVDNVVCRLWDNGVTSYYINNDIKDILIDILKK